MNSVDLHIVLEPDFDGRYGQPQVGQALKQNWKYHLQFQARQHLSHALMDAELARQGLRPTRVFSDGSSLPTSFGNIQDAHEQARHQDAFAPILGATRQANDARVAGHRTGTPATGQVQEHGPSPIRTEIQSAHKRLQDQAASVAGSFDSKAQIVETPDGTLKSKKSLFTQTGKQVVGDADVSLDAAKDAAKNVLKRLIFRRQISKNNVILCSHPLITSV